MNHTIMPDKRLRPLLAYTLVIEDNNIVIEPELKRQIISELSNNHEFQKAYLDLRAVAWEHLDSDAIQAHLHLSGYDMADMPLFLILTDKFDYERKKLEKDSTS